MFPQIAALIWGAEALSYPTDLVKSQLHFGDIHISGLRSLIILIALAVTLLLQSYLRFTRSGQAMRAIADDQVMSQLVGINIHKYIALIFLIAGGLSGIAGVLMGPVYYASYSMGVVGVKGFAAAVIGGFGNVTGALLGGLLLGLIEAFGGTFVSSQFQQVILYGIFILVLIVMPQGILGIKQRRDTV
jgi:branched-chain amino acid transport system permease protein